MRVLVFGWIIAILLVGCLVAILVLALSTRKKKPQPDLIDLEKYAAEALESKDKGCLIRPPHSIPGKLYGNWTCEEMEMMRSNRRIAQEIYEHAKRK